MIDKSGIVIACEYQRDQYVLHGRVACANPHRLGRYRAVLVCAYSRAHVCKTLPHPAYLLKRRWHNKIAGVDHLFTYHFETALRVCCEVISRRKISLHLLLKSALAMTDPSASILDLAHCIGGLYTSAGLRTAISK